MDQAIIFCRTKLDCDNVEHYLVSLGGGENAFSNSRSLSAVLAVFLWFSRVFWFVEKAVFVGALTNENEPIFFCQVKSKTIHVAWRACACAGPRVACFPRLAQVECFPALCTVWMFSRTQHHLFDLASLCDRFTGLFTFLVIGQKWLFVYWSLRGVFFPSLGPKAMVNEYSCVCLHSDRSPQERKANLQAFKVTIASYTTECAIRTEGNRPYLVNSFDVVVWLDLLYVLQK